MNGVVALEVVLIIFQEVIQINLDQVIHSFQVGEQLTLSNPIPLPKGYCPHCRVKMQLKIRGQRVNNPSSITIPAYYYCVHCGFERSEDAQFEREWRKVA